MGKDNLFVATGVYFGEEALMTYAKKVEELPFEREGEEIRNIFVPVNLSPRNSDIYEEWFGTDVKVEVIGYGKVPGLEAFLVRFYPTGNEELNRILKAVEEKKKSVIVISCMDSKAMRRINDMPFWGLETTFFMEGKYGATMKNGKDNIGIVERK